MDDSSLRSSRVSGVTRLACSVDQHCLDESTIEAVIGAAADPKLDFSARRIAGFREVVEVSSAINGPAWADEVLIDSRARFRCFKDLRERALRLAASSFARLHRHDRETTVNRVATELILDRKLVPGTNIKLSSWDAWYAWNYLLRHRLKDAATEHDKTTRPGGVPYVPLDDFLTDSNPVDRSASRNSDPGEVTLESLGWHSARHLAVEWTEALLAPCRGGAKLDRLTTICRATRWLLEHGADDPHLRTLFVEDVVSSKTPQTRTRVTSPSRLTRSCIGTRGPRRGRDRHRSLSVR